MHRAFEFLGSYAFQFLCGSMRQIHQQVHFPQMSNYAPDNELLPIICVMHKIIGLHFLFPCCWVVSMIMALSSFSSSLSGYKLDNELEYIFTSLPGHEQDNRSKCIFTSLSGCERDNGFVCTFTSLRAVSGATGLNLFLFPGRKTQPTNFHKAMHNENAKIF